MMDMIGIDLASGPDRIVKQRVFIAPPSLYEAALEYYKGSGIIVVMDKPLEEISS